MSGKILKEEKGIIYEILQEKDLEKTAVLISEVFQKVNHQSSILE